MEHFETGNHGSFGPVLWTGLDAELRLASNSFATATLVVLLLCASRESMAQTVAEAGRSLASSVSMAGAVAAAAEGPIAFAPTRLRRQHELDALLAVRSRPAVVTAGETDQAIAAAVARGSSKELERPQPFRKKNNDLFRAQRAVQIGNQDMLLRLRLRPKTREVMSVELRF